MTFRRSSRQRARRHRTGRRPLGRHPTLIVAAVAGSLATACGIPADSGFQENDELVVGPDTTSVAPTTTSPPTTTAPPTSDTSPPPTPPTSVNEPVGLTEPVLLYFVGGPPQDETLSESTRALSYPARLQQVLFALIEGPSELESPGLRTLIDDDLVHSLTVDRGVLTIDIDGEVFFDLGDTSTQRSAIGQLVLTFGQRQGVGQVRFTQDGEPHPIQVPVDGGRWQNRSSPVAADEFEPMLAESQLTPDPDSTTTTTPDTTSTTDPDHGAEGGGNRGESNGTTTGPP